MARPKEIEKKWFLVNADGKVLGRIATEIARILRGKHKATYTPHLDTGDFVIVINADKIRLTGNKLENKKKYHHTGYPGGIKEESYEKIMAEKPQQALFDAVKGMMPKSRLGNAQLKKLKIYSGSSHEHEAQKPIELQIASKNGI